jgi:hypothetical protein
VLFGIGYALNHGLDGTKISEMMEAAHGGTSHHVPTNSAELVGLKTTMLI